MKDKAVFLDRDGTLIEDNGYMHKISDLKFLPGVIDGLKRLKNFKLFIITNQSGISKGYFSVEQMHKFNKYLLELLKKESIEIHELYFCPHSPTDKCDCRKPNTKFVDIIVENHNIDIKNSFVFGDKPAADIKLAKNASCKSVYLLTGHGIEYLHQARELNPDYISAEFNRAADFALLYENDKLTNREKLPALVSKIRKEKKKVVTINGTFDILHKGHDFIISESKKQGDILIVGINSDSSVKSNKGKDRPINNELARAKMIAGYEDVDFVTIFKEKTPIEMLEIIKPDVHVNGSEYGEDCIEEPTVKKHGGKIHIVKLMPGYSSTKILSGN